MNTIEILAGIGQTGSLGVITLVRNSGPVAKMILAMLLVFSVISWAIILLKYIQIRKAARESAQFLRFFWESRSLEDVQRQAKNLAASPIAEAFLAGYTELLRYRKSRPESGPAVAAGMEFTGVENIKRTLRQAMSSELAKLERAVPFLATVGNTSPFIGLFGTVWGIMDSFRNIGEVGSASLAVVAPGISEALITTAMGLFAAIPAVIFYNFFSTRIRFLEVELDNFSAEFLNILDRHITRLP
jgi:biopolymer transport protein TolQ